MFARQAEVDLILQILVSRIAIEQFANSLQQQDFLTERLDWQRTMTC